MCDAWPGLSVWVQEKRGGEGGGGGDKRLIALSQETRLWETNISVLNISFGNMLKKYAFPNFCARKNT